MYGFEQWIKTILTGGVLLLMQVGCTAPPQTVALQTIADPGERFDDPAEYAVAVIMARYAAGDSDERALARSVRGDQLSLEERQLLDEVRRGFLAAGFEPADVDHANLIAFCAATTITGEVDTYRRVPMYEYGFGTIHTRHGFRTYRHTTQTDVIVTERRQYADHLVQVWIHHRDPTRDPHEIEPDGPTTVWIGRLRGRTSAVDADLAGHVRSLLEDWGRSGERVLTLERE